MFNIQFNDAGEFIAELERYAQLGGKGMLGKIVDGTVRCTKSFRRNAHMPIETISVVATFAVGGATPQIFRLDNFCGEAYTHTPRDPQSEKVLARGEAGVKQIGEAVEKLGLRFAAGVVEFPAAK